MYRTLGATLAAIVIGTQSFAATLLYDEAADGDLSYPSIATRSLATADTHLISGTTTRGFGGAATDIDELLIQLGAGLTITNVIFDLKSFSMTGSGTASPSVQLANIDNSYDLIYRQQFSGQTPSLPNEALPATGDGFRLSLIGGCGGCAAGSSFTYGWSMEITTAEIAAVPAPASLPLLLAAGSGIAFFGRRGRKPRVVRPSTR